MSITRDAQGACSTLCEWLPIITFPRLVFFYVEKVECSEEYRGKNDQKNPFTTATAMAYMYFIEYTF